MIIHNIEQRTDAWDLLRKAKFTASKADVIITCGKGLETYAKEVALELLDIPNEEDIIFMGKDVMRGIELEPKARELYELSTGNKVEEVGFIEYNEFVGCSPDGLVNTDGLIEIKCPNNMNYLDLLLSGREAINPKYLAQVQMQLYITERAWCDMVFYNPNFNNNLLMIRIEPDQETFNKLGIGILKGISLVKEYLTKLK